ncbi:cytochrome c [Brevibacillus sp. SYP-B805]|uniref:cytochrome c551 n=1 Tax=Brevibacillus sp. SYP-B805 TaxID=1578199 RepID=UPI0013ED021B|nr:cytochrome c [Brevibacillus sp. SYP-B805]NGQ95668.1 cytochrome c [Brevibacillus sp. SYP-B805]
MNGVTRALAAGAFLILASACGTGQQTQPPAQTTPPSQTTPPASSTTYDAAAAENVFKSTCAGCHGQNLEGMVGPNLTHVGSKYSKDQIREILEKGKGSMPAGLVKGADADNIAAWLADKK